MAAHLTRVIVKGFEKCCTSNADDDTLWNGSEEDGNVWSVIEIKALTMKMKTVTLIGKGS